MKNKLRVLLLMLGCVLQIHAEQVFDMASFGIRHSDSLCQVDRWYSI